MLGLHLLEPKLWSLVAMLPSVQEMSFVEGLSRVANVDAWFDILIVIPSTNKWREKVCLAVSVWQLQSRDTWHLAIGRRNMKIGTMYINMYLIRVVNYKRIPRIRVIKVLMRHEGKVLHGVRRPW